MGENDIADFTLEETTVLKHEQGLAVQNLAALILDNVTAETFEVMSRQATINVGTIGHVAHGKSTVVKAISGVKTQKFIREAIRNITIHLGYANAKVYQCGQCEGSAAYHAFPSSHPDQTPCPTCGSPLTLRRHFSFVDCPGHGALMATMLDGAAIMDAALLLIAANELYPQPQTLEHLAAAEMMRIPFVLLLQNKIDLVHEVDAMRQQEIIRDHIDSRTAFRGAPILPISAQLSRNMDVVLEYLCHIPFPVRQLKCPMRMWVLRSFDISTPGDRLENLCGGVVGGNLDRGCIVSGQELVIRPGLIVANPKRRNGRGTSKEGRTHSSNSTSRSRSVNGEEADRSGGGSCAAASIPTREGVLRGEYSAYVQVPPTNTEYSVMPLRTTAESLMSERNTLQYAIPGGLIAIGTTLDPSLTRQNKLIGQVICSSDDTSAVYSEIEIQFYLLQEIIGLKRPIPPDRIGGADATNPHPSGSASAHDASFIPKSSSAIRVKKIKPRGTVAVHIGTLTTAATVLEVRSDRAMLRLAMPVCCEVGTKLVINDIVDLKFRIIGWGVIRRGVSVKEL